MQFGTSMEILEVTAWRPHFQLFSNPLRILGLIGNLGPGSDVLLRWGNTCVLRSRYLVRAFSQLGRRTPIRMRFNAALSRNG